MEARCVPVREEPKIVRRHERVRVSHQAIEIASRDPIFDEFVVVDRQQPVGRQRLGKLDRCVPLVALVPLVLLGVAVVDSDDDTLADDRAYPSMDRRELVGVVCARRRDELRFVWTELSETERRVAVHVVRVVRHEHSDPVDERRGAFERRAEHRHVPRRREPDAVHGDESLLALGVLAPLVEIRRSVREPASLRGVHAIQRAMPEVVDVRVDRDAETEARSRCSCGYVVVVEAADTEATVEQCSRVVVSAQREQTLARVQRAEARQEVCRQHHALVLFCVLRSEVVERCCRVDLEHRARRHASARRVHVLRARDVRRHRSNHADGSVCARVVPVAFEIALAVGHKLDPQVNALGRERSAQSIKPARRHVQIVVHYDDVGRDAVRLVRDFDPTVHSAAPASGTGHLFPREFDRVLAQRVRRSDDRFALLSHERDCFAMLPLWVRDHEQVQSFVATVRDDSLHSGKNQRRIAHRGDHDERCVLVIVSVSWCHGAASWASVACDGVELCRQSVRCESVVVRTNAEPDDLLAHGTHVPLVAVHVVDRDVADARCPDLFIVHEDDSLVEFARSLRECWILRCASERERDRTTTRDSVSEQTRSAVGAHGADLDRRDCRFVCQSCRVDGRDRYPALGRDLCSVLREREHLRRRAAAVASVDRDSTRTGRATLDSNFGVGCDARLSVHAHARRRGNCVDHLRGSTIERPIPRCARSYDAHALTPTQWRSSSQRSSHESSFVHSQCFDSSATTSLGSRFS